MKISKIFYKGTGCLIIALSSYLFTSCEKAVPLERNSPGLGQNTLLLNSGTTTLEQANNLKEVTIGSANLDINNYLNLFKPSGVWHNEVMEKIGKSIDVRNQDLAVIYSVLKENINQRYPGMSYHNYDNYVKMIANASRNQNLTLDISADIGDQYSAYAADSRMNLMIEDFEGTVNGLINSNQALPSPLTVALELSKFKTKLILKYGAPTYINGRTNNVGTILLAASITEYSYSYWYNSLTSVNATWHEMFVDDNGAPEPAKLFRKLWQDVRGLFWGGGSSYVDNEGRGYTLGISEAVACSSEYSGSVQ